jgi:hypothetical protein
MVLKGAFLIVCYCRGFGLRPMSDFDFLVPTQQAFEAMRKVGREQPGGHLFPNRRTLAFRVCQRVKKTCSDLGIDCLGTRGFRGGFAAQEYRRAVDAGRNDRQALLAVSRQLGHNRLSVAACSYVPPEVRIRSGETAAANSVEGNLVVGPCPG